MMYMYIFIYMNIWRYLYVLVLQWFAFTVLKFKRVGNVSKIWSSIIIQMHVDKRSKNLYMPWLMAYELSKKIQRHCTLLIKLARIVSRIFIEVKLVKGVALTTQCHVSVYFVMLILFMHIRNAVCTHSLRSFWCTGVHASLGRINWEEFWEEFCS